MKKSFLALGVLSLFCLGLESVAQFKSEEIADFAKWEEFLRTANIVGQRQMSQSEGVTRPWDLILEKNGVRKRCAWKDVEGRPGGYIDNWRYEIAAYKVDRLIGLDMVPPTVERRFHEERGSLQLWVDSQMSLKKKEDDKIKTPSYKVYPWNLATYLERAFDNLIGNEDRHMNNILITKDWGLYLIDHSRSFRTSRKFTDQLIYRKGGKEGDKLMLKLPRAFVEKIRKLDSASLREAVGEYLADAEIDACLKRRDLILKEVERLIKENGEAETIY